MLIVMLLLGCASPSTPAAEATPTPAPSAPPTAECLDKADKADGAVDHVIHRCPNCAMVMDGDAKFSSTHGAYTVHSCSKTCKEAFDKDPGEVMARACAHP
jgi:YHS domain-containing protein